MKSAYERISTTYRTAWAALEADTNPFATVVMAHLQAQEMRQNADGRRQATLARRLYTLGYGREAIVNLYRFIDWLLRLPEELEAQFWQELQVFEEAQQMPYITSVERIGIAKGMTQGREEGLREGLLTGIALAIELKFGAEAAAQIIAALRQRNELSPVQTVYDALRTASTADELLRLAAA